MKVKSESEVTQSCLTLRDPMDCSLPGSSIHGIFQARVLEWGAIAFSGNNEETEPKQKQHPVVNGTGDRSKIRWCKEQYCIGTWNVKSMNQGKLEGVKEITSLDSILKSRVITLPTKVRLVKAMVFPVVMYGCESWTTKKVSAEELMLFLESLLDCKKIKLVNPKGNQS